MAPCTAGASEVRQALHDLNESTNAMCKSSWLPRLEAAALAAQRCRLLFTSAWLPCSRISMPGLPRQGVKALAMSCWQYNVASSHTVRTLYQSGSPAKVETKEAALQLQCMSISSMSSPAWLWGQESHLQVDVGICQGIQARTSLLCIVHQQLLHHLDLAQPAAQQR